MAQLEMHGENVVGTGAGREEMLFAPTENPFLQLSVPGMEQPQDTCLAGILVALRSYGIPWVSFRTG